jgi:peptide deformylase
MSKLLRLYKLSGDEKLLRTANQEISFPLSKDIKRLIEDMKLTVKKAPGVGLAAPQIGKNLMLAVINLESFGIEPFAIINPRIISKSIKKTPMEEGCLSVPGFFKPVKRPARIEVETFREDGQKVLIRASGLLAKVLQHEIDHLNGTLIIDKIKKE